MEGWIKLHRCLMEKAIWLQSTPEQKVILITLLAMANHKEKQWIWQGNKFEAIAGQFVTSLDSIVKQCGIGVSKRNVRTAIDKFENLEFLTNESTKTGRLITITNWDIYQEKNFDFSLTLENSKNRHSNRHTTDTPSDSVDIVVKGLEDDRVTKKMTKHRQSTDKALTPNKNERMKECNNLIGDYTTNIELIESINSFIEMRKSTKSPMTDKAIKLMLGELNKLAGDNDNLKIEILNQSIMCNWKGVFALKQQKLFNQPKREEYPEL